MRRKIALARCPICDRKHIYKEQCMAQRHLTHGDLSGRVKSAYLISEWEETMQTFEDYFAGVGVPRSDAPVSGDLLQAWIKRRCLSRKMHDDWAGVRTLHWDFLVYAAAEFTVAAFLVAIARAGFAIDNGMVSRLVLRSDYESMQVRSQHK